MPGVERIALAQRRRLHQGARLARSRLFGIRSLGNQLAVLFRGGASRVPPSTMPAGRDGAERS